MALSSMVDWALVGDRTHVTEVLSSYMAQQMIARGGMGHALERGGS